jgi:Cdc6-like AAA superfamily ATPase
MGTEIEQDKENPKPVNVDNFRSWLAPTDFESEGSEYRKHLNAHFQGTGDWIFQSENYRKWYTSEDVGTLWIRGAPGCGKSVLSAHLIQSLRASEKTPVLFFFSRRILASNSDPKCLVRDCLYKALDHCTSLPSTLQNVMDKYRDVTQVPFLEMWKALVSALAMMTRIYVVIDALDELRAEQDMFIDHLMGLGQKLPRSSQTDDN